MATTRPKKENAVDDPSASPRTLHHPKDVASTKGSVAFLNRPSLRRRKTRTIHARPAGGCALIPAAPSAAADHLPVVDWEGAIEKPSATSTSRDRRKKKVLKKPRPRRHRGRGRNRHHRARPTNRSPSDLRFVHCCRHQNYVRTGRSVYHDQPDLLSSSKHARETCLEPTGHTDSTLYYVSSRSERSLSRARPSPVRLSPRLARAALPGALAEQVPPGRGPCRAGPGCWRRRRAVPSAPALTSASSWPSTQPASIPRTRRGVSRAQAARRRSRRRATARGTPRSWRPPGAASRAPPGTANLFRCPSGPPMADGAASTLWCGASS